MYSQFMMYGQKNIKLFQSMDMTCSLLTVSTETSSSFTLLNIYCCVFDWTTFQLVLQHKGMAAIKKSISLTKVHFVGLYYKIKS